jgi:hypothetical protein
VWFLQEVDPENPLRGPKRLVAILEKTKIYAGGNLHALTKFFERERGDTVNLELPPVRHSLSVREDTD